MELSTPLPLASAPKPDAPSLEVQMLRRQVKVLTAENEKLKKELAESRKRTRTESSAYAPPNKKARTVGQKKKLFEKWAKALTRECKKHKITNGYGVDKYSVTVKDAGIWSQEEFDELFSGQGNKIQPTPENKPTSVITILDFSRYEDIKAFFADVGGVTSLDSIGYEVQMWRSRSFQKSVKYGTKDSALESMQVHYNKSKHALSLVFNLETEEDDDYYL